MLGPPGDPKSSKKCNFGQKSDPESNILWISCPCCFFWLFESFFNRILEVPTLKKWWPYRGLATFPFFRKVAEKGLGRPQNGAKITQFSIENRWKPLRLRKNRFLESSIFQPKKASKNQSTLPPHDYYLSQIFFDPVLPLSRTLSPRGLSAAMQRKGTQGALSVTTY